MWIMTTDGFISVVASKDNKPNLFDPKELRTSADLVVRSRSKDHLKSLFPKFSPIHIPSRDYEWRVFVPREVVSNTISVLIEDIDYTNFKNTVLDIRYHHALSSIWRVLYNAFKGTNTSVRKVV